MTNLRCCMLGLLAAAALGVSPATAQVSGPKTIDIIRARGELVCGVSTGLAGFSLADSKGVIQGIDADSCRAIAAAVLGDGSKVRFVPTTTINRFTALQSGEVDLLVRSITWTLSRDANLGLVFVGINFYDGTGFIVKKSSGFKTAKDMDGATICVLPGTSTELAVSDFFRTNRLKFTPLLIADLSENRNAFLSGRCDAYSSDLSNLAGFRAQQGPQQDDYVVLPDAISKEPLGIMVRKGDERFVDVVRWSLFGLLQAEESGVTQANIDEMSKSTVPEIRRLLGLEGDLGKALGIDNGFVVSIVKAVGNYGEMFDRTIGRFGVRRGMNNLWNNGGLHYAPPFR